VKKYRNYENKCVIDACSSGALETQHFSVVA